jgi:hypothetical protein
MHVISLCSIGTKSGAPLAISPKEKEEEPGSVK